VEIRDYLDIVRRGWVIILGVTVVVAGLAALYTFTRTPLYESRAKVFVSLQSTANIQDLVQGNVFTQQATQGCAELAVTPIVLDTVIDKLGLKTTSSELGKRINASAALQSTVLSISVRDESPDVAVAIANGVSARLSVVAGELATTASGTSPVKITLIQPAIASQAPVIPKKPLYLLLGTLAGLVLGFVAAAVVVRQRGPGRGEQAVPPVKRQHAPGDGAEPDPWADPPVARVERQHAPGDGAEPDPWA
jgi:succinoglycan biosynthesis transport protein ExoP